MVVGREMENQSATELELENGIQISIAKRDVKQTWW